MTSAERPEPVLDLGQAELALVFQPLARLLEQQRSVSAGGLWGSAQALALAALERAAQGPWLVVVSTEAEVDPLVEDLASFGLTAMILRARSSARGATIDPEASRSRLVVAQALAGAPVKRPRTLVASLLALLEPLPSARTLAKERISLAKGRQLDVEALLCRLVDEGYTRMPLVEKRGEVSLRGDIFDVFAFADELPVRIELFDREIESLRSFDPLEQRSLESFDALELCLASDAGDEADGVLPFSLLSPTSTWVEIEPLRVADRAEGLRIQSSELQRALLEWNRVAREHRRLDLQSLPGSTITLDTRSVQALAGPILQSAQVLRPITLDGTRVIVLCRNDAEEHRFRQVLEEAGGVEGVSTRVASLARGFRLPAAKLVLVNHRELAGIQGATKKSAQRPAYKSRALQSFFDLKPGDFVVHAVHGMALYRGLVLQRRGSGEEEHLHLEFADEVSLFVPASRIDLVQRYIGGGKSLPPLDKIGSQAFRRRRERVERALIDLAGDLLEVQARRELRRRKAWKGDAELVRDMVGSFPWIDTPDQSTADREITRDLESERPMDRLLCGDVGFGKTEVAMRSAFRVVAGGGQVAVLVPTTVLAHQHLFTFRERLADFPLRVEGLSRTALGKEERRILDACASGEVDVLIGTHRLLSKDVRFKRLGLLVIDEEQRFGVLQKEHFKTLRADVDVLTLSATPIPRTLHMSLSGLRDISALSTPPPGRQAIETRIVDQGERAFVRQAILDEKNRGGQVFFLHNRVHDIQALAAGLAMLVPECSFAIGHGQMGARELEKIVDRFVRGETDVLVATTIIENGLDIPAAGTIFIDEADHFGLSELHQLRGRVGRGQQKAFCYLLVESWKPVNGVSRERLKALEELNHLGAGFQISMKDLELRGAGNLLGAEQSGHIAAVGYDMYCRLLRQTVERLKAGHAKDELLSEVEIAGGVELELGLRAYLPQEWIPSQDTRLEILRALDSIHDEASAREALDMLRDRFGRIPEEAATLVRSFLLRARAQPLGISRIAWRDDCYQLEYRDRLLLQPLFEDQRLELRPIRSGLVHVMLPARSREPLAALEWLERVLQRGSEPSTIPAPQRHR